MLLNGPTSWRMEDRGTECDLLSCGDQDVSVENDVGFFSVCCEYHWLIKELP